ncbi:carboxymuconolactone decarboxylase family protein [Actinocrispum wychmicini]|uniref:Carboxymuconolactone decarboxylase family protein n=1 Tax=Actinocrispum wychmicini TaxID=1213861 RepID=A0A4R2JIH2_9PSEU|nr:carboxymuconolactone decarboxylase family protein [Actinocrispum wychmicini]TCO59713.1 carboxymuconolactone decarboxylase family protein [Actinocrispum wychmicini]
MELTIHQVDTAPGASRPVLAGIAADVGLVPNMAAAIAAAPALLAAFDGMRRAIGAGELNPVHREAAGVAVGVVVDNEYGVAFHSTVLGRLDVAEEEIKRMRAGEEPADEPTAAVYALARELALHRGKAAGSAVARAVTAGLSTAGILEVVAECAFAALVGMVDNVAGRVPLDNFLQPWAWRAPTGSPAELVAESQP